MISAEQAIRELNSEQCPACGGTKRFRNSFCRNCYKLLPEHMQRALYRLVGNGYEQAVDQAKRCIAERRKPARTVGAAHHRDPERGRFAQNAYRKK